MSKSIPIPVGNLVEYLLAELRKVQISAGMNRLNVRLKEIAFEFACASADSLPIDPVIELGVFSINTGEAIDQDRHVIFKRLVLVDRNSIDDASSESLSRISLRIVS